MKAIKSKPLMTEPKNLTVNALGTVNIEEMTPQHRPMFGVWHYKPTYSYLLRLFPTDAGVVAESTCLKVNGAQVTAHIAAIANECGIVEALNEAFEWLEEQTRPRGGV